MSLDIFLTNNLTNKKEKFIPQDKNNVRMYVCGPTVYDDPHNGNARPVIVFDILFKLLKNEYSDQISKNCPSYINVLKIINNYFNN